MSNAHSFEIGDKVTNDLGMRGTVIGTTETTVTVRLEWYSKKDNLPGIGCAQRYEWSHKAQAFKPYRSGIRHSAPSLLSAE